MLELTFLALAWLEKSRSGMFSNKTGAGLSKGSGRVTDVDVHWDWMEQMLPQAWTRAQAPGTQAGPAHMLSGSAGFCS